MSVGSASGPSPSPAVVLNGNGFPSSQFTFVESNANPLTKSYPSVVRFGAMLGCSKRTPMSSTATVTLELPVVTAHALGRSTMFAAHIW